MNEGEDAVDVEDYSLLAGDAQKVVLLKGKLAYKKVAQVGECEFEDQTWRTGVVWKWSVLNVGWPG
jgi:hypothetical protein